MNLKKLINGQSDYNAFQSYKSRNFWRAYARSVGGEQDRSVFAYGAMPDAHGKYEPFVMPAIERAIEAVIARQIKGMNILYPPGNYSMLERKFRVSELPKSTSPIYWGYAKMPFERARTMRDPAQTLRYYRGQYIQWNKNMNYISYEFAPHKWMARCHSIVKNQMDMDKAEKGRKKWDRKPWHELIDHDELTFLLAAIPACIHENIEFLNEIRAGEHTYMGKNPIISASALAALREAHE